MTEEIFKVFDRSEFLNLLQERGLSLVEIGDSLQSVEQVLVLSDGRRPVYIVEFDPKFADDITTLKYMMDEFIATNIAAILVPSGMMKVSGAITGKSFEKREKGNG